MVPTAASGRDNPSDPSLDQLQRQRSDVQSKKASKASEVNTLEASDAEVTAALQTLNANVSSQQDRVEEAERAVAQAEADQKAAEDAQAQAQAELDTIRTDLRQSAIETYMSAGSSDPASVGAEDANEAVAMRTLMSMRANEGLNLAEQYRSKQEDLEIQRSAAADARERATQHKANVDEKLKELKTAQDQQQAFAAQVEARLNSALAEADSLSQIDATLGGQIAAKQAEIAKALAAQRAAEAARAAARAAQNRTAVSASSGGGGGGGGGAPSISGAGPIVSVGGIQVSASIAGNLQSLLAAAAADGINFGGGGYRDPSGQIAVRRSNCGSSNYAIYEMPASSCSPPTARPGTSMHERGLAIDFTDGGGTLTRGSAGYSWLRGHAAAYGFSNLPSEPWHWSTNGQ